MIIYQRKYGQQGIPLVPMLDILTILLIFFIVHTEFKKQVSVLRVNVPKTSNLAGETISRDGNLLEIAPDGNIALNGQVLTIEELSVELRRLTLIDPNARLLVSAADAASLGRIVSVMDELSKAGVQVEQIPLRIDYKSGQ